MVRVVFLTAVVLLSSTTPLQWGGSVRPNYVQSKYVELIRGNPQGREFVFARLVYPMCAGFHHAKWFESWATDFPKADRQFVLGLKRLTNIDAYEYEYPVRVGEGEIHRFPFLYAVEVGWLCLRPQDQDELRRYLTAGGFLFIDDFWGTMEWENFETEFRKVLPDAQLKQIPLDHQIFRQFYEIDELVQVPNVGQGIAGGPTHESDGYTPEAWGFFDKRNRLMVLIMHNTDLGDAWEWAESPYYPLKYGNYAYKIGINTVVYAMSH